MSPFRGKFRILELKVCVQGYGQTIDSLVGDSAVRQKEFNYKFGSFIAAS